MSRRPGAIVLGTILIGAAMSAAAQGTDRTAWVQVVVTNAKDELVSTLTADDFVVLADGREQSISEFSKGELPMALSIMLDVSPSLNKHRLRVRQAAQRIFGEFDRGDRVNIGAFDSAVWITQRFTASPQRIFWSLEQPFTGADTPCVSPGRRAQPPGFRSEQNGPPPLLGRGGTAVWDAVWCGVRELLRDRESIRKVMLLVTDGKENSSRLTRDQVHEYAERAGALIYAIGFYGIDGAPHGLNEGLLRRLSGATGGRLFKHEDEDPLEPAFERIGQELRAHYVLGFEKASSSATGVLEVRVKTPGLTARARTRF